jgi:hypothetical protein
MLGFIGQTNFQWIMFQVGLNGQTKVEGLCFEWVSMVELNFNGLCFAWVSLAYVSVDYFSAFQTEMWLDLTWSPHSDFYELNVISFKMIVYVSNIIVSCF